MGIFDKAKQLLGKNEEKIESAIDKAAGAIDDRTKHKHSDKITKGVDAAKGLVERLGEGETEGDEVKPTEGAAEGTEGDGDGEPAGAATSEGEASAPAPAEDSGDERDSS